MNAHYRKINLKGHLLPCWEVLLIILMIDHPGFNHDWKMISIDNIVQ